MSSIHVPKISLYFQRSCFVMRAFCGFSGVSTISMYPSTLTSFTSVNPRIAFRLALPRNHNPMPFANSAAEMIKKTDITKNSCGTGDSIDGPYVVESRMQTTRATKNASDDVTRRTDINLDPPCLSRTGFSERLS